MKDLSEVPALKDLAAEAISSLTAHAPLPASSRLPGGLTLAESYEVTSHLRAAFEARGERIVGRKIGFTNRLMWVTHGVQAPVWGYCTDRTTSELTNNSSARIADFVEPRIEPEIVFGLASAPAAGMDEGALLDCIQWVAPGFEIVQSIFPDWKFTAADTVAANALHGALLVGPRRAIAPRKEEWLRELATFTIELHCDGCLSQSGGGALVLDSPLLALRHLAELLESDPRHPPLQAGEIISTGTLTLAMPVQAGQTWTTKIRGIALDDIALGFEP